MWVGGVRVIVFDDDDRLLMVRQHHEERDIWMVPGGGIEDGETSVQAAVREMKEETGLNIKNPQLCGIKEWDWGNETRYIALLYKTNEFSGEIKASNEGKIFWMNKNDLHKYKLSTDFEEIFNICIK